MVEGHITVAPFASFCWNSVRLCTLWLACQGVPSVPYNRFLLGFGLVRSTKSATLQAGAALFTTLPSPTNSLANCLGIPLTIVCCLSHSIASSFFGVASGLIHVCGPVNAAASSRWPPFISHIYLHACQPGFQLQLEQ